MSSTGLYTGKNRRAARSLPGGDGATITTTGNADVDAACDLDVQCMQDWLDKKYAIDNPIGQNKDDDKDRTTTSDTNGEGSGPTTGNTEVGSGSGNDVTPPKPGEPPALQSYYVDYILVGLCLVGVATAIYMISK